MTLMLEMHYKLLIAAMVSIYHRSDLVVAGFSHQPLRFLIYFSSCLFSVFAVNDTSLVNHSQCGGVVEIVIVT